MLATLLRVFAAKVPILLSPVEVLVKCILPYYFFVFLSLKAAIFLLTCASCLAIFS
jgi:hypothetical protein